MTEIDRTYLNFEACLKCSICNTVCPMMEVNGFYPGPKTAGPDQERYRLKDPAFYDYALKYCLNCKRCEVACPSNVPVADLIRRAKLRYASRSKHPLRDAVLGSTDLVGKISAPLSPLANQVLGFDAGKRLIDKLFAIDHRSALPKYSAVKFTDWFALGAGKAQEKFSSFVSYFHGCYANYNYPQLGKDFVKIMNAAGYGVHLLEKERCCGAAALSNSLEKKALKNAKINIASFEKAVGRGEPILTSSAGCTLLMRDEYSSILGLDTSPWRDSLSFACKWLWEKIDSGEVKLNFKPIKLRLAYHTACHMQKLGWRIYSIELLKMIPGLQIEILDQNCCGVAGAFGFKKEYFDYSQKIGRRLFDDIADSAPDAVVSECEACKWQIEKNCAIPVLNPLSVIASALE